MVELQKMSQSQAGFPGHPHCLTKTWPSLLCSGGIVSVLNIKSHEVSPQINSIVQGSPSLKLKIHLYLQLVEPWDVHPLHLHIFLLGDAFYTFFFLTVITLWLLFFSFSSKVSNKYQLKIKFWVLWTLINSNCSGSGLKTPIKKILLYMENNHRICQKLFLPSVHFKEPFSSETVENVSFPSVHTVSFLLTSVKKTSV